MRGESQVEYTVHGKVLIPATKKETTLFCVSLRSKQEADGALKLRMFQWGFIYKVTNCRDVAWL